MAFSFDSRVRYSETGVDQKLTILSLVDYFQDCSTFQSELCGHGVNFLKERNRAWMVAYWQIEVLRYPKLCEKITVQTWPYDFKGFYGLRNFALLDAEGAFLARANSVWVMIDTVTGRPCRVTQGEISGYQMEPKLEMEYLPRKIATPEDGVAYDSFQVCRHHLDTNDHVNNGQYIGMAEEYLPEGFQVSRVRVEYRSQAHLHDVIVPVVTEAGQKVTVMLCNTSGKAYAVVEFVAGDSPSVCGQ